MLARNLILLFAYKENIRSSMGERRRLRKEPARRLIKNRKQTARNSVPLLHLNRDRTFGMRLQMSGLHEDSHTPSVLYYFIQNFDE